MIRLFDEHQKPPRAAPVALKTVGVNAAGVGACAILALYSFGIEFAAGESPDPMTGVVTIALAVIALALMIVGAVSGVSIASFPWPVIVLTPLLLGSFFSIRDPYGFREGCIIGGIPSVFFFIGAVSGRRIKEWMQHRARLASPRLPTN